MLMGKSLAFENDPDKNFIIHKQDTMKSLYLYTDFYIKDGRLTEVQLF